MAFTMPAGVVLTGAGAPAQNLAVTFYAPDGTTVITPRTVGTSTAVTAPRTNANGIIGPYDFDIEWGYVKCGSAVQQFFTTAVGDLARKGTFANPYVSPSDTSALPTGAYYTQVDANNVVTMRRKPSTGSVAAIAPSFIDIGRKTAIPSVSNVEYLIDGTAQTSGVKQTPGSTVTVTARATGGRTLTGTSSWSHTFPEFNWFANPRVMFNRNEWSIGGGGSMAFVTNATGFSHGTTTAIQQTSVGSETWLIFDKDDFFITPAGNYVLRFELKRQVAARTDVTIQFWDVLDNQISNANTQVQTVAGVQWVSVNITKPANAVRIRFLIDCYGSNSGEVIQATNFSITEAGVFFDGAIAGTAGIENTWESTPNAGYSRRGAPKARLFDADFANAGFGNYYRLAPTWVEEGTDYGIIYDDQLGMNVAWLDSSRRPTLGNNFPRVGIDAPDFIIPAIRGNTQDEYWVGFSVYYPSTHPLTTADGWCTFSTGGFGPPWGASSKTGIAMVMDAQNVNHVLSIGADGQFVTEFPLDTWVNIVIGYKFAYDGWLELHTSIGANNTNMNLIPFQGQQRRYVDTLTAGGNDGWVNDPTVRACCTGLSAYGSQVCRALFSNHRVARTMEGALPFGP